MDAEKSTDLSSSSSHFTSSCKLASSSSLRIALVAIDRKLASTIRSIPHKWTSIFDMRFQQTAANKLKVTLIENCLPKRLFCGRKLGSSRIRRWTACGSPASGGDYERRQDREGGHTLRVSIVGKGTKCQCPPPPPPPPPASVLKLRGENEGWGSDHLITASPAPLPRTGPPAIRHRPLLDHHQQQQQHRKPDNETKASYDRRRPTSPAATEEGARSIPTSGVVRPPCPYARALGRRRRAGLAWGGGFGEEAGDPLPRNTAGKLGGFSGGTRRRTDGPPPSPRETTKRDTKPAPGGERELTRRSKRRGVVLTPAERTGDLVVAVERYARRKEETEEEGKEGVTTSPTTATRTRPRPTPALAMLLRLGLGGGEERGGGRGFAEARAAAAAAAEEAAAAPAAGHDGYIRPSKMNNAI
uniref:Uncharacterized protein n=1 Tax=Oryza rufipogon TaxID=4529 RepID=A0A0E0PUA9_ORYRU